MTRAKKLTPIQSADNDVVSENKPANGPPVLLDLPITNEVDLKYGAHKSESDLTTISATSLTMLNKTSPEKRSYSMMANDLLSQHKSRRESDKAAVNSVETLAKSKSDLSTLEALNDTFTNLSEGIYDSRVQLYTYVENGDDDAYKYYGEALSDVAEITSRNELSKTNSVYSDATVSKRNSTTFESPESTHNRINLSTASSADPARYVYR